MGSDPSADWASEYGLIGERTTSGTPPTYSSRAAAGVPEERERRDLSALSGFRDHVPHDDSSDDHDAVGRVVDENLHLSEQTVSFERVGDRSPQLQRVDFALDQKFLRALHDGLQAGCLGFEVGQHDDWDGRRLAADLGERVEALAVRQHQVEEHEIELFVREQIESVMQADGAFERVFERLPARLVDVPVHEQGIVGVVFN